MIRIADARTLEELYGFSDADIPAFKRMMVDMREAGNPLQLPPPVAAAATAKGFEEGVHFDITRPIPKAGAEIIFIMDHDVVKSPGEWVMDLKIFLLGCALGLAILDLPQPVARTVYVEKCK